MNNKQKQVQIPEETFLELIKICSQIAYDDQIRAYLIQDDLESLERCLRALNDKLDKIILHDLYSKSKNTTLSDAEQEKARQEYLNRKGIHKNFRY